MKRRKNDEDKKGSEKEWKEEGRKRIIKTNERKEGEEKREKL